MFWKVWKASFTTGSRRVPMPLVASQKTWVLKSILSDMGAAKVASDLATSSAASTCSFSPKRASLTHAPIKSSASFRNGKKAEKLVAWSCLMGLHKCRSNVIVLSAAPLVGKPNILACNDCSSSKLFKLFSNGGVCSWPSTSITWLPCCGQKLNPPGATYPCFPRGSAELNMMPIHSSTAQRLASDARSRMSTSSAAVDVTDATFICVPRLQPSMRCRVALLRSLHSGEPASVKCDLDGGMFAPSSADGANAQPSKLRVCKA
mmetsp:Transcript_98594/g.283288  ORF Transcript_98594/g.283288 Transcript_98594/m.283288 type:complete len:262 (-) Transcript_98594:742-1527(-)